MRYHRFDFPDLPLEAFRHYGDRRIKPQGGGGGGWLGEFVSDPLGTTADTASDIVNGASDTLHQVTAPILDPVSKAVADVGQGVSDVIHDVGTTVAKDPLLSTAAVIALTPYIGAPAAAALVSANAGASPENIVKNMVLAGVSAEIAQSVAPEVASMTNKTVGSIAGQAAGSATTAALTGRDPIQAATNALITGGINAGTTEVLGQVEGFGDLTPAQQKAVSTVVAAELQGKDPTTALINQAINAGKQAVQDEIKYAKYEDMDFGVNQGAIDKVAEMEAREREAEDAARAAEEQRLAEEENIRLIEEERLRQEATQPPPQAPITVPGEGGTTATIDPNTGEVTFSEPPPAIETPVTEPSAKEPDVTQTLTDAGLKEEPWTPPTGLPSANTPTGLDNERGVNESGVLMPDGSFKTWAELDELAGVPPGTIYTDGGTTITEKELQDILNGTYTNPKQVPKPGAGTNKPTTPAPKPTTPTTPAPTAPTQQNNSANMLALLSLLQPQQQQQAPPPVQGADVKLMEDIFGTNFITPRPEGTKKYSSGGEIEALLHLLRS